MAPITQLQSFGSPHLPHGDYSPRPVPQHQVWCDTWQAGQPSAPWKLGLQEAYTQVWALPRAVAPGAPGLGNYLWNPYVWPGWGQAAQVVNKVGFGVKLRDRLQHPISGQELGSGRKGANALTWTSD